MADCDNKNECTCTANCNKHAKCCECVAFHRSKNQVPGCFFTAEGELSYNRSIKKLAEDKLGIKL